MKPTAFIRPYLQRIIHTCIILSTLLSGTTLATYAAPPLVPDAAPADEADFLFTDAITHWAIGGGFIYWAKNCYAAGDTEYLLKRKPLADGAIVTIQIGNSADCDRYYGLVADDNGVYYYNKVNGLIEFVPVTSPNGPPVALISDGVAPISGDLALDAERVYWGNDQGEIYYVPKSGGNPQLLIMAKGVVEEIEVASNHIYWIDDDGLWWADSNCAAPCTPEQLFAVQFGSSFTLGSTEPLGNMHRTLYLWHGATIATRQLMLLPASTPGQVQAELLYEVSRTRFPGPVVAAGVASATDTHLYWTESGYPNESPIRRIDITGGSPDDIYIVDDQPLGEKVFADDEYLYFTKSIATGRRQFKRIPLDAAAIERDIEFTNWEVTQAVQNLENEVPLVADKPTVVRVYGTITGGNANAVQAQLEGRRKGEPLPGSPLRPVNGPLNLPSNVANARSVPNHNWIFELPASWLSAGEIELTAQLDPYQTVTDPNPANNSHTETFTFDALNDVCIYSWPVHSHAPIPSAQDPNVSETFDLFERLWPIDQSYHFPSSEPIEELETCWGWGFLPYPCWGPYELGQERNLTNWITDQEWVMLKLAEKQLWTIVAGRDTCDSSDSRHALGLVHADSDPNAPAGKGSTLLNTAFVKLPPQTAAMTGNLWAWPRQGQSLAHELAHNLGRGHVDCNNPKDHVDSNYPYGMPGNNCVLDDREDTEATTNFGYDLIRYEPIHPTDASDFLGYGRGPRWVSDYTFKGIMASLATSSSTASQATSVAQETSTDSVFVSGLVEPNLGLGQLEYVYIQPNSALNVAALQNFQQSTALAAAQSSARLPRHYVRFVSPQGKILAKHDVVLSPSTDSDDGYAVHTFAMMLPAPVGAVGSIELIADRQVLFTRTAGLNVPTVTILAPTAGTNVDDALEVRWTGVDPDTDDILLYNVDYSADNGKSWVQLVANYPGTPDTTEVSYTLHNPSSLPGTNGNKALIRVVASDGYNTGMAVSQPFVVAQRVPEAHILNPHVNQWAEAGAVVPLRGAGQDAEDGTLAGSSLRWTVDGFAMGNGKRLLVAGFAPGSYPVTMQAVDSTRRTATDQGTLNIAALDIPLNNFSGDVDGRCDDMVYQGGKQLQLAPYSDGSQATVQFVRTKNVLVACFSNMIRAEDGLPTQAALYFDTDDSRDGVAQPNDVGFLLGEDGTPSIVVGDGSGGFVPYADNNYGDVATQVSAVSKRWQAEFRIPLDGWNPLVGLLASHLNVNNSGEDVRWPYRAVKEEPNTWAATAIVDFPRMESVVPFSATVGAPATTLEIAGTHFAPNSKVTWDGQPLATIFVSESLLKATVDANQLLVAGNHAIQVVTPGLAEAPAPGHHFNVTYPAPQITQLMPNAVVIEGPAFDLTVFGTDFANGATVLWNGEAQPTVHISATELRATIPASALVLGREVNIRISNPTPNRGGSNTMTLLIQSQDGAFFPTPDHSLYLPLVHR